MAKIKEILDKSRLQCYTDNIIFSKEAGNMFKHTFTTFIFGNEHLSAVKHIF